MKWGHGRKGKGEVIWKTGKNTERQKRGGDGDGVFRLEKEVNMEGRKK